MKRMLKGFTLIELLVVVAIIAILAAMLLPALQRAREEAKKAACIQGLKNVGVALQMYLSDYNEWHPYYNDCANSQVETCGDLFWYELLTPYTEGVDVFECPGSPQKWKNNFCGLTFARRDEYVTHYAMNHYTARTQSPDWVTRHGSEVYWVFDCQTQGGSRGDPNWRGANINQKLHKDNVCTDGRPAGATGSGTNFGYARWYNRLGPPPHNYGINVLFCDGHVEWLASDMRKRDWGIATKKARWYPTYQDLD